MGAFAGIVAEKNKRVFFVSLADKKIFPSWAWIIIKRNFFEGSFGNVHFIPLPMMSFYKKLRYDIKNYPVAFDNIRAKFSSCFYDITGTGERSCWRVVSSVKKISVHETPVDIFFLFHRPCNSFPFFILFALLIISPAAFPSFTNNCAWVRMKGFLSFQIPDHEKRCDKKSLLTVGGRDVRITRVGYFYEI